MSLRTEEAYVSWVKRFILFHDKRHPADMGTDDIRDFLTHLAVHGRVAASTQNAALNALVFLYRHVLQQPFPDLEGIERAKRPKRIPTVFTADEMQAILAQLSGTPRLMAGLLYGAGLRLSAMLRPLLCAEYQIAIAIHSAEPAQRDHRGSIDLFDDRRTGHNVACCQTGAIVNGMVVQCLHACHPGLPLPAIRRPRMARATRLRLGQRFFEDTACLEPHVNHFHWFVVSAKAV